MNKKQVILDYSRARDLRQVELNGLRAIRQELQRRLGPDDRTSFAYIASVLRAAGLAVQYEDRYSDPIMPEPYASRLKSVLKFHDLASAEQSLVQLDAIYRDYQRAGDQGGMEWVRTLLRKGRLRVQSLARNPRVKAAKRREKQEIARWFQVWLETPDLLASWLELRKSSEEFRKLFGNGEAG
jgi:hypothetical protein